MSRVDDDRETVRLTEKLMLQRQKDAKQADAVRDGSSAFSKLVGQGKAAGDQALRTGPDGQRLTAGSERKAAEGFLEQSGDSGRPVDARSVVQKAREGFSEQLAKAQGQEKGPSQQAAEGERSRRSEEAQQGRVREQDHRGGSQTAQSRREDARAGARVLDERSSPSSSEKGASGAAAGKEGTDPRTERDSGNKGGGGSQGEGGNESAGAGFRFNPALMAPVAVARPKDNSASERLRALANEIAQKIVQSARVGTNALGEAEFQIDLRSNVLSGLSIKVSGGRGRIKAAFSGSDREVLKLLRENSDGLRAALKGKGLNLEELKIDYAA